MKKYSEALTLALQELFSQARLKPGQILVIGCSTSEVLGNVIGKGYSQELGQEFFKVFEQFSKEHGVKLAFQCCEHLNRALVVERDVMERFQLAEVTAVPVPGAGGSMAASAYQGMEDPVLVEHIQAHAGIDIGDTFIGMHLRPVAIPIRLSLKQIGAAHVTFARTRPKLIGGQRAVYPTGTCS